MAELAQKDRIVILGRPSAGKSVFLTVLYQQLWDSPGDLTMRAGDGATHASLLQDYRSLMSGAWLPATQAVRYYDLEVRYRGASIPLMVLDYPGELYRKMFFEKRVDSEELETLFEHIARARGVILLLDPEDLVRPGEAQVDTEYSAIQVVEHFRNSHAGPQPPLVVVFTKRDQNAEIIRQSGGLQTFLRKYAPRLTRFIDSVPVVHLTAVRTSSDNGRRVPWAASSDEQVAIPLRLILKQIEAEAQRQADTTLEGRARTWWNRHWWPTFVACTTVGLFFVFFAIGVWIAS